MNKEKETKLTTRERMILSFLFGVGVTLLFVFNTSILNTEKKSKGEIDSLFEKQEKCASYREDAKQRMEDNYSISTPYFYDIFYSPKTDTCIYTYGVLLVEGSSGDLGSFIIADYFSGANLFSVTYDNSSENIEEFSYNKRPLFSEKVEEYRKK